MRIPPNLKYFVIFLLAIGIIGLATVYLPRIIPHIGDILIGIVSVGMFILIFFVFIKPFIGFLYARADGIFAVYMDLSEKGFHIFSYHISPGGDGMDSTRDVQQYFINLDGGKLWYRKLFTHDMTPTAGRSGWGNFYSFEESVLGTIYLERSLEKLSQRSGLPLKLGRQIQSFEENVYEIRIRDYVVEIKQYTNAADSGFRITCTDNQSQRLLWKKRI